MNEIALSQQVKFAQYPRTKGLRRFLLLFDSAQLAFALSEVEANGECVY
jgi:hypothetical protein